MKKIAILGSTGSIGTQTLDVVREQGDISVAALAAGSNIALLEQQIREFHPRLVAVWDKKKAEELKIKTADLSVEILECLGSGQRSQRSARERILRLRIKRRLSQQGI